MYEESEQFYYSPSDLTRYIESPFASWMDRLKIECPEKTPEKDPEDALMTSLANKGHEHEANVEAEFTKQGKTLKKIEGGSLEVKKNNTIEAMRDGIDVIAQARLDLDCFGGYADFLVKVTHSSDDSPSLLGDWHYEVWDAKLASSLKPAFVIQLCCYAQMLEPMQGRLPEFVTVALGSGDNERLKISDYYYYYQSLKDSFIRFQGSFDQDDMPDLADSKNWGGWCSYAEQLKLEKDHLLQVANISRSQIKKLNHAGVSTMQRLVDSDLESVQGIQDAVYLNLKAQASIQKRSVGNAELGKPPEFEIIKTSSDEKLGLALLPPHSNLDVFFDIEGYPLDDGGLEYLWGAAYFDASVKCDQIKDRAFIDFWAHNQEQERECFQDFIKWVYERWQQDPSMHIYHYANYEIAACRKLMSRYGVCEYEVDQLLRNEVFVDLYKVVRSGVLIGEPRYSIKNVELLYRDKRETQVGDGGDSVAVYEKWRELNQIGEEGDSWQKSKILNDIRDYNIDDCNSTQELVGWLRKIQVDQGIDFLGRTEITEPEITEEIKECLKIRDRLLKRASSEIKSNPDHAALMENLAGALEFHQRESKPVFWRLFDRLGLSHVELMDDLDCLGRCVRTDREAFKPTARARNLAYEYRFDSSQEFKATNKTFSLLGTNTAEGKAIRVNLVRDESDLENGVIALQSKDEPPSIISLIPDEYVNPAPIPQAIQQIVGDYEKGKLISGKSAIIDFLTRASPRIKGRIDGPIAVNSDPEKRLNEIVKAIRNLDHSYLTIQGPPGTGKTYTGKHVIAELVKSGAKVGISSNSHKAINNLLLSTVKHCRESGIEAVFGCSKKSDEELLEYDVSILKNNELVNHIQPGCVVGTTVWGFAREDMVDQLDYLFIDEAGQVAVANLIAMSRSANNLILMGDQMQLGQPLQGTHPADSGLSVLDYLLHERSTISDDMGVFLGTGYRMHSMINKFISRHVYDGRLESHPDNDLRVIEVPDNYNGPLDMQAGITFVPVEHEGNTQASVEEVEEIKRLANSLIGRTFHTGKTASESRKIGWNDMLFVAPYNHQVSKLCAALGERAKVGSVDKFQGQEAPVVFLSMCASDASESPRGLNFLFDKRRLNVAISRAQSLTVVVGSSDIGETRVDNVNQLKLVNMINALQVYR